MAGSFSATVGDWCRTADGALEAVFRESAQQLLTEMDELLEQLVYAQPVSSSGYQRTGFLRASVVASTSAMPTLNRQNPGLVVPTDLAPLVMVINDAELGSTLYLGYTANYAAFVHYSTNGHAGRPWVDLAAQRWAAIVAEASNRVRQRLGL